MAYSSPTIPNDHTSDAAMRAMGAAISAQFAAMGLVQTSDTGQVNWTTVTRSGSANTVNGYEIWRFNDALQSTYPIFIKVEYGNNNTTNMAMWFQVGTATNGAGTLSGTAISTTRVQRNTPTDTTARTWYFAGTTSSFAIFAVPVAAAAFYFSVERTPDAAGADTNVGYFTTQGNSAGTTNHAQQVVLTPGGLGPVEYIKAIVSHGASSSFAGNTPASAVVMLAGKSWGASRLLLVHNSGDFTVGSQFPVTIYGASHNFLSVSANLYQFTGAGGNNDRLAVRFE